MRNPADSRWYETRWAVLERDKFTCRYCGQFAPNVMLHVDHVTAVCEGGTDDLDNLVTACSACNIGKEMYRAQTTRTKRKREHQSVRVFPMAQTSIIAALEDAPEGLTIMQIADVVGRDRTSVIKPLNRLADEGVVTVTREPVPGARGIRYVYRLAER